MHETVRRALRRFAPGTLGRGLSYLCLMLACVWSAGCAAMTDPVADGIPVRLLPPELAGPPRTDYQTLPLSVLRQLAPAAYQLDAGDVLGVYIDGFLGDTKMSLPIVAAPPVLIRDQNRLPPSAGYPIMVQEDGTIALPAVPKLSVKGMTIGAARDAIRNLYVVKAGLLNEKNEKIVVTLMNPRTTQVMVFRQEAQNFLAGQDGPIPISKRNTGHLIDLPAYQNDVLSALVRTGGLPESDAYNQIIIYRDRIRDVQMQADVMKQLDKAKPGAEVARQGVWIGETVRIPLRLPAGAPLPFSKDDVILHAGDVIFLETRDEQAFYTAGLLPSGKHTLPRDHDLDVLEAIALVRGPLYNGAFGGSSLAGNLIAPGLGSPSPSLCVVVRRVPGRGQVPIAVDLRSAMLHPQERLVIRPGDLLILQEKPAEAFARYFTQTFLNFEMMLNVFHTNAGVGAIDVAAPDRLSTRPGVFNILP